LIVSLELEWCKSYKELHLQLRLQTLLSLKAPAIHQVLILKTLVMTYKINDLNFCHLKSLNNNTRKFDLAKFHGLKRRKNSEL